MGILDDFFDPKSGQLDKLSASPLWNIGLGILANNNQRGSFGAAIGRGGLQGMQAAQEAAQAQQIALLRKQQLDMQKAQFDQAQRSYADTQAAIAEATRLHPELAGAFRIDPKAAIKAAYPALQNTEFGMSPRVGINPATGKPEYVSFGNNGNVKFTGVVPTQDEIKQAELIDRGVALPQYGASGQPSVNNAPQVVPVPSTGLPTNNFTTPYPVTFSGPTATDIKEGTSPDMQLRNPANPNQLAPASRRKLLEKQGELSLELQNKRDLVPVEAATAGAKKAADIKSEAQANAQVALPGAQYDAAATTKLVDDLLNHPGFESAVGFSSYNPLNHVAGTQGNDFNLALDQLKGKQFLQAYQNLKGGGSITEVEGKKATDAISRMNTSSTEEGFRKAANDFKDAINAGYAKLQKQAIASQSQPQGKTVVKRGKYGGRNVVQYSDGSIDYAD